MCAFAEDRGLRVGATVHVFDKVKVKGKDTHPLWKWLKQERADPGCWGAEVKWNFTKVPSAAGTVAWLLAPCLLAPWLLAIWLATVACGPG